MTARDFIAFIIGFDVGMLVVVICAARAFAVSQREARPGISGDPRKDRQT